MAENESEMKRGEGQESGGKGSLFDKMKKKPEVWIGLAVAVATLIIGFLAYQHSQSSSGTQGSVPGTSQQYATQGEFQQLQQEIQQIQGSQYGNSGGYGHPGGHGGHHRHH